MKKHYFYIVYSAEAATLTSNHSGSYYADIFRVSVNDNIAHSLEIIGNLLHANICETKKAAEEIRDTWNQAYKNNGTYAF